MRTGKFDYPRNDNRSVEDTSTHHAPQNIPINRFTDLILEVGALLLESGAHCERINRNIQRIAQNTDYKIEMLLTFTALSVSVTDRSNPEITITKNRRIRHHGAHFGILTNTSLLTWELVENERSLIELEKSLDELRNTPKHPLWLIRLFIGIACGCLCLLSGGDWIDGAFALFASASGLLVRQEMVKKGFNLMVSVACSAFITTTISGMNILYGLGGFPESSVATAVLFLIPGVPLINSIICLRAIFL